MLMGSPDKKVGRLKLVFCNAKIQNIMSRIRKYLSTNRVPDLLTWVKHPPAYYLARLKKLRRN